MHRQLAATRADDLALDADVVAEVDVGLPVRERLLADLVEREHHLHLAGAVAQRREAELAAGAREHDPAGDADPGAGPLVRLEVGVRGAQVGDRRGARERHGLRLDPAVAHPVELLPAYAHLLGQLVVRRHALVAHPPRLPTAGPPVAAARSGGVALEDHPQADQGEPRLVHVDHASPRRAPAARARRSRSPSRRPGRRPARPARRPSGSRRRRPGRRSRTGCRTATPRPCCGRSPTAAGPARPAAAGRRAHPAPRPRSRCPVRSRRRGTHPWPTPRRTSSRCRSRPRCTGPPNSSTAASALTTRSVPTSLGLSVSTGTPVRTPGSTTTAGTSP